MASPIETESGSSSKHRQKQSSIAEKLPGTSATRASATIRTSRYPWSTRWGAKFIESSFTGKKITAINVERQPLSSGAVIEIVSPTRSKQLNQILGLGLALLLFGSGIWANVSGGSLSQEKGAWVSHASR